MQGTGWKIDLRPTWANFPIGLFRWKKGLWGGSWEEVSYFETREEARALYEQVKDLPEYL